MSTSEAVTAEADQLLAAIPAFALLEAETRGLVADSFELLEFPFGATIVEEGDDSDAFYLLAFGSARVLKRMESGEEVPLNVLSPGDTFGEAGLLAVTTRGATVRASSDVRVLCLHASVFAALARRWPEVRDAFESIARSRALWNLFRLHDAFRTLPNDALATLVAGLERVEVAAGSLVIAEGDAPGAMFVVEKGRLRSFHSVDGVERNLAFLRVGDVFGERSLFVREPRAASVVAVDACTLLELSPELFESLLSEYQEFRHRIEERAIQYDYRRIARVPLDFADEILPVESMEPDASGVDAAFAPEAIEAEKRLDRRR